MNKFTTLLLDWFYQNKRDLPWRKDKEPYHVWLSEIMLQQTRVEAVKAYYKRFLNALPDIKSLSECPDDKLLKLWEGLGYYNRVRNLKIAATTIMQEYDGVFPNHIEDIRSLKGIGDYTAGAIGSICFDLKTPAVDGNVLRVLSRVWNDDSNIDLADTKKRYAKELLSLYPEQNCGDFTQSLMELGAIVCIPNGIPKCEQCPIRSHCLAHQNNRTHLLPVRSEKKPRKHVDMTVYVFCYTDENGINHYGVQKRTAKGLLSGLYEFPNVENAFSIQEALEYAEIYQVSPKDVIKELKYTHIFTHVEWHMTAYYLSCNDMSEKLTWVTADKMEQETPLPTAFRVFWEAIV